MNRILLALRLVKVARLLVAFSRNQLETELKRKRLDLKDDKLQEHLDCLEKMDAKEQKAALYWINKNRLVLPEDLSKFKDAMNLINKQHLDFQEFEGPMEVVNRNDKSTKRIKSQDINFSPSSERAFSHPYNAGGGVVIYDVEDSKEGQLAVRKAIDVNWGYDKNPWCLAARKNSNTDDDLKDAWNYWNYYNAYPKRIAFKNGKLLAFSAGEINQSVEWWDKNDKSHDTIPGSDAVDDIEFLKRHGKFNLLDSQNTSPEMLEELSEDEDWNVRSGVAVNPRTHAEVLMRLAEDKDVNVREYAAKNPNTPAKALMKLAEDKSGNVRQEVAENPSTPVEAFMKLAEDEDEWVRYKVAENPRTPVEAFMKLAEDEDADVRYELAGNPNTSAEVLMKLAEDEDADVRKKVAKNPNTSVEVLMKLAEGKDENVRYELARNPNTHVEILRKLADDKEWDVRCQVAKNLSTPAEALIKLAEDKNENVRTRVAANSHTPAEVLRKLAEDKSGEVRYEVAMNPKTPAEALRKLAEDENADVRGTAKRHLKQ